jgi:hypothetical protein
MSCDAKHPKYRIACIRIGLHPGMPHKAPYHRKYWIDWNDEQTMNLSGHAKDGYQIYATDPVEGEVASYTEAESPGVACWSCLRQFPENKGFTGHRIKNLENNAEYRCTKKESV